MTLELKKRLITGMAGAALLLGLIIYVGWIGMVILTTVVSLGMVYEFTGFVYDLSDRLEKRYVILGLSWFIILFHVLMGQADFALIIASLLALFIYYLFNTKRHIETELPAHFKELMASIFGLIYLVFIPLMFLGIFETSRGVYWTILFLFIVWSGDIGAYFAGLRFGKTKLFPEISPKKTQEGALGSLLAAVLMSLLYKIIVFHEMTWLSSLLLPLLINPLAQIGDLCESFLKRAFNVKDSGAVLPGHGGFLDRFDSILFGLPIMYASVRLIG